MAQVTIYLPPDVAREVRSAAKKAHKSVSSYMAELATQKASPAKWSKEFLNLGGRCDLAKIDDLPVEDPE